MDNISFSKKFAPDHDNGERNMCWKTGFPPENGTYLITTDNGEVKECKYYRTDNLIRTDVSGNIVAWMKLPKPYKPD